MGRNREGAGMRYRTGWVVGGRHEVQGGCNRGAGGGHMNITLIAMTKIHHSCHEKARV